MIQYGLCNASLDEALEYEVRVSDSGLSDKKVIDEVNRRKKELTMFNANNTKYKSMKKSKKMKKDK